MNTNIVQFLASLCGSLIACGVVLSVMNYFWPCSVNKWLVIWFLTWAVLSALFSTQWGKSKVNDFSTRITNKINGLLRKKV